MLCGMPWRQRGAAAATRYLQVKCRACLWAFHWLDLHSMLP